MSTIKFGAWQDLSGNEVANSTEPIGDVGLVLIKSQAIVSGVSSVTVSDVFSSTYDNYRLLVHVGPTSAIAGIKIQFGTTTGNLYYGSYAYALHTDTSTTNAPQSGVDYLYITDGDTYAYAESLADVTVYSPNIAQRTTITGMHYGRGYSGWQAGQVATSDQYTSFVLFPSTGTFASGGTIKVYGYRN